MERMQEIIEASHVLCKVTNSLLDKVVNALKWNESATYHILHVGCGPGNMTKDILVPKFKNNIAELIGVDKRKDFIYYARQINSDEKVMYRRMDIQYELFTEFDGKFDLVISLYFLDFVKDKKTPIKNMIKCIKPGGHITIIFEMHKEYDDFMYQMSQNSKWAKYMNVSPPVEDESADVLFIVRTSGFHNVCAKIKVLECTMSRLKYIADLKRIDEFAKKMTAEEQIEYFRYIEEEYVNKKVIEDEPRNIQYTRHIVHIRGTKL